MTQLFLQFGTGQLPRSLPSESIATESSPFNYLITGAWGKKQNHRSPGWNFVGQFRNKRKRNRGWQGRGELGWGGGGGGERESDEEEEEEEEDKEDKEEEEKRRRRRGNQPDLQVSKWRCLDVIRLDGRIFWLEHVAQQS